MAKTRRSARKATATKRKRVARRKGGKRSALTNVAVYNAIAALKDRKGSSAKAILAYLKAMPGTKNVTPLQVRVALARGVKSKALIKSGMSFKLRRRRKSRSRSRSRARSRSASKTRSRSRSRSRTRSKSKSPGRKSVKKTTKKRKARKAKKTSRRRKPRRGAKRSAAKRRSGRRYYKGTRKAARRAAPKRARRARRRRRRSARKWTIHFLKDFDFYLFPCIPTKIVTFRSL